MFYTLYASLILYNTDPENSPYLCSHFFTVTYKIIKLFIFAAGMALFITVHVGKRSTLRTTGDFQQLFLHLLLPKSDKNVQIFLQINFEISLIKFKIIFK